jgi:HK97 family phage prohead protease
MFERRDFQVSELHVEKSDKPTIVGHAAVFNQKSAEIYGFREIVKPGAFAKSIQQDDIRALWNHNPNYVLGRRKNHTLELIEDRTGLAVRIFPGNHQPRRR